MSRHREEASSPIIVSPGALFPRNHMVRRVGGAIATAWRGDPAPGRGPPPTLLSFFGGGVGVQALPSPPLPPAPRTPGVSSSLNPLVEKDPPVKCTPPG